MRMLTQLLRSFSNTGGGRRPTGRRGVNRSRGMGTTAGAGGVGSVLRRFLR